MKKVSWSVSLFNFFYESVEQFQFCNKVLISLPFARGLRSHNGQITKSFFDYSKKIVLGYNAYQFLVFDYRKGTNLSISHDTCRLGYRVAWCDAHNLFAHDLLDGDRPQVPLSVNFSLSVVFGR